MTGKLLKTAVRNLLANPLRTILTLLGIVIGVASVVTLMSVGQSTTQSVTSRIQGLGTNLLIVTPGQSQQNGVSQGLGSAQTLTLDDVKKLQGIGANIAAVAPDATSRAQVTFGATNYQVSAEGSTPDIFLVRNLKLSEGRMFNLAEEQARANVAVIGPTTAENVFGDQNPVGQTVWVNGIPFQIIGELDSQGASGGMNSDDRLLIPLSTLQTRLSGSSNLNTIYVSASSPQVMTTAQNQVEAAMRQSHGLSYRDQDDFVVSNQATLLGTLQDVTHSMQTFLGGIAGISLVVGGIGIMNIMLVAVTERTREIGLRKALGATRSNILRQFLFESALVGVIGGLIGILIGWLATVVLGRVMSTSVGIDFTSIWISLAVSLLAGLAFGTYPALRASRLSPMLALRYE